MQAGMGWPLYGRRKSYCINEQHTVPLVAKTHLEVESPVRGISAFHPAS